MSRKKEMSFAEISREVDQRVAGADVMRAELLAELSAIRGAKESAFIREQKRLSKKLGAKHPRVAEIANRRVMNAGLIRDLKLESERAQIETPRVDPKTWVVFGIVRDKDLNGVPALTIALYDAKANWIEQTGFACTQQNGSFRIETRDLEDVEAPLFLRVLTAQAEHLYSDQVPLTPKAGGLDYREIILPEGAQACAPPLTRPHDPVAAPNTWIVRGRVTDKKGRGLSGLTVTLFDKDLLFDDRLGQTETDENGNYSFTYRSEDFGDMISQKPDLFLTVKDRKGKKLFTSKQKVIFQAGKIEIVNIQIDAPDQADTSGK